MERVLEIAERWFETSISYHPAPFACAIKVERSVHIDALCDFDQSPKEIESGGDMIPAGVGDTEMETAGGEKFAFPENLVTAAEDCTPKVRIVSRSSVSVRTTPKSRKVVAPKCAAVSTSKKVVQPSSAKTPVVRSAAKTHAVRSVKGAKPSASDYGSTAAKSTMAAEIALQNQAVKRQKLDGGKARQIINVKGRALPHKSKLGPAGDTDLFTYAGRNYSGVASYVSTVEMVKNFQKRTRFWPNPQR